MTYLNGYQTVLNFDFTAQTTQTLTTDGNYAIGGYTWTKFNSANEVTHATITNGTGLNFQPTSGTDYNGGTRSFPGLYLPLQNFMPPSYLDPMARMRVMLHISSANLAASYDAIVLAMDVGANADYGAVYKLGTQSGGSQGSTQFWNIGNSNLGFQNDSFNTFPNLATAMFLDIPRLGGDTFSVGHGLYNSGFPVPGSGLGSTTNPLWLSCILDTGARHDFGYSAYNGNNNFTNLAITLGAHRAGSGTALSVTMAHLRVDVLV